MSIEENFNIGFIAALALREKQIQQNYRPLIAVHKWFARRPGTLFRGLILSEFSSETVENNFYASNSFSGKIVADPFMGGGTPLLEANRLGCDIIGADINPMAKWIVNEEIAAINLTEYSTVAQQFLTALSEEIGHLYKTRCPKTGRNDALVKYFLWVKVGRCESCANDFDLFPSYMISENVRHPYFVLVCPECGDLNEVSDLKVPGRCKCSSMLKKEGPVKRSKCLCPHCEHENTAPFRGNGPPQHRLFAIEYFLDGVKEHTGRLFKKPDVDDLKLFGKAASTYQKSSKSFIPEELISKGDESSRLHRWGYAAFKDLFNARQLLGLQISAEKIALLANTRVAAALATNFSDLLRYQNMLCRYDTMALKSLDIFSIHGFPVGYM